ncbi:hypothetical protein ACQQ2N_10415 [Dokdonella sp. MW10]|uniref:hypothetical protein n=1 Tax=Dokdonella sp. MW10 TaxID=2992926 RepID=UPI003F7D081D
MSSAVCFIRRCPFTALLLGLAPGFLSGWLGMHYDSEGFWSILLYLSLILVFPVRIAHEALFSSDVTRSLYVSRWSLLIPGFAIALALDGVVSLLRATWGKRKRPSSRRDAACSSKTSLRALAMSCLLVAHATPVLASGFDYAAYREASLAAVGSRLDVPAGTTWWLDAAHYRFHTVVDFTGQVRVVRDEHRFLVERWAKAMGHGDAVAAMFTSKEIEVRQDDKTYWVPVQKQLIAAFRAEVPAGSEVRLYLILIGAHDGAPVFGVNEFAVARPSHEPRVRREE